MGLYDDEKITSGEFPDLDFRNAWQSSEWLEAALKTRQPEGAILPVLEWAQTSLDAALKKWPDHEQLKAWKAKADQIDKKINKNAPRDSFKETFQWTWSRNYDYLRDLYYSARGYLHVENWSQCRSTIDEYVGEYERHTVEGKDKLFFDSYHKVSEDQRELFAARCEELKKMKEGLASKA